MNCKVCQHEAKLFDENVILEKYKISYYQCPVCGTIFTEKPYWLEESYSEAIAQTDVGLV